MAYVRSADGTRLFCSVESEKCLKIIDTTRNQILGTVPLTGTPNQLAITPDGKWIYVAIADTGSADVVDVAARQVVKTLPVGRHAHNCYCPKAAKFIYSTSIADHLVRQFDYRNGHTLAQTIRFDGGLGGFFGHAGPVEECCRGARGQTRRPHIFHDARNRVARAFNTP